MHMAETVPFSTLQDGGKIVFVGIAAMKNHSGIIKTRTDLPIVLHLSRATFLPIIA